MKQLDFKFDQEPKPEEWTWIKKPIIRHRYMLIDEDGLECDAESVLGVIDSMLEYEDRTLRTTIPKTSIGFDTSSAAILLRKYGFVYRCTRAGMDKYARFDVTKLRNFRKLLYGELEKAME